MSENPSIGKLLTEVAAALEGVSESPRLDAELLLGRAIDMPRAYLFAHPEDEPDNDARDRLQRSVERRRAGEPMAYITGRKEFWSMDLIVSPATLVPRPETEILVDRALSEIPRRATWTVLDLGTGSGAVAVAIAKERPHCKVVAVDRNADALRVAELNAREFSLANLSFLEGDWTAPVAGRRFDLIVSNPPYVRAGDPALSRLQHEPADALVAGADGLGALRILARDCAAIIAPGGLLALEHGAEQQQDVDRLLTESGWVDIVCHRDYSGLPRVTAARRPATQAIL